MSLDREEQRDIDIDTFGNETSYSDRTLDRAWHFYHHVRTIDRFPEPARFLYRRVGIMRDTGRNLDRDESVGAACRAVDARKPIAGITHVSSLE